ncbi:MAG: GNAT family N-acetyltransferase [Chitinophagaceae bacterium]|nr:GNAT family N-acetyltransferase [Chitinophagaceae bacterium]
MVTIVKATTNDAALLADIGRISFIESHGHSAPAADIDAYVAAKYTPTILQQELSDPGNIYHILYHGQQAAGYSKIILHSPHPGMQQNITKLERIYLLKEFYQLKLGYQLLQFNIDLSKKNNQAGMWLYVWKENHRAVNFYIKAGFQIIGSYDFKLSETHSNPNHRMLLLY